MNPALRAALIFVFCQAAALYMASEQKVLVDAGEVEFPQVSAVPALVYFFGIVVVMGLIVYLVRHWTLRLGLKIMFSFLFAWGVFNLLSFFLPLPAVSLTAVAAALAWLLFRKVWLHNILMGLAAASAAATFGFLLTPWTVIFLMLVISVYDIVAVRSGYMVWLADRLSQSEALPGFIIPERLPGWNLTVKEAVPGKLAESLPGPREFSVLGGGDIIFPLVLAVSVFSAYGAAAAVTVGVFSLLGIGGAYLAQRFIFGGKATPALPPIFVASLAGFLIAYFRR